MRFADRGDNRSTSGRNDWAQHSLNPGTMTFGKLFAILLTPPKVPDSMLLVSIIVSVIPLLLFWHQALRSLNADISCNSLVSDIECSLSSDDLAAIFVSPVTVSDALSLLKLNKSDGIQLVSNHFIHASTSLILPLSKFFSHAVAWLCS